MYEEEWGDKRKPQFDTPTHPLSFAFTGQSTLITLSEYTRVVYLLSLILLHTPVS